MHARRWHRRGLLINSDRFPRTKNKQNYDFQAGGYPQTAYSPELINIPSGYITRNFVKSRNLGTTVSIGELARGAVCMYVLTCAIDLKYIYFQLENSRFF